MLCIVLKVNREEVERFGCEQVMELRSWFNVWQSRTEREDY